MKTLVDRKPLLVTQILRGVIQLFQEGVFVKEKTKELPWTQINEAYEEIESGKANGKIVAIVTPIAEEIKEQVQPSQPPDRHASQKLQPSLGDMLYRLGDAVNDLVTDLSTTLPPPKREAQSKGKGTVNEPTVEQKQENTANSKKESHPLMDPDEATQPIAKPTPSNNPQAASLVSPEGDTKSMEPLLNTVPTIAQTSNPLFETKNDMHAEPQPQQLPITLENKPIEPQQTSNTLISESKTEVAEAPPTERIPLSPPGELQNEAKSDPPNPLLDQSNSRDLVKDLAQPAVEQAPDSQQGVQSSNIANPLEEDAEEF